MALVEQSTLEQAKGAVPGAANEDELIRKFLEDDVKPAETAAPEAPQEEVRVVAKGDTLLAISQEVGVPLLELARNNNIEDVNLIMPGQEIKYTKPAPLLVETDISAKPEEFTITPEGTTTAVEAETGRPATKEPFTPEVLSNMGADAITTSDEGTRTDIVGVSDLDFDVEAAVGDEVAFDPDLDGPPVDEEPGVVPEDLGITDQTEASAKLVSQTIIDSSSEESKPVIKDVFDEIDTLGFDPLTEADYKKIAADINDRIEDYNINISTVASEKMKPTFEGWDKFLAVLGSALGSYGSAMTGSPNFALKIVNQAIDRDTQAFLKSKEARMKSLENQRLDLIMIRGEKLQMAQNRVTQLMQSQTFELAKVDTKANIKALYDKLDQELALNKENYNLVMAGMIKDFMISDATLKASISKEERIRYVNSFSAKDAEGNTVIIPGYVARDAAEAKILTEDQKMTSDALDYIAELDELYESVEKYIPAWAGGKVAQRIDYITSRLELTFKRLEGMGANYTQYEQALIRGILPTATLIDKFSKYKVKSASLKQALIKGLKTSAKVRGQESQIHQTIATQGNIEKFSGKRISN